MRLLQPDYLLHVTDKETGTLTTRDQGAHGAATPAPTPKKEAGSALPVSLSGATVQEASPSQREASVAPDL